MKQYQFGAAIALVAFLAGRLCSVVFAQKRSYLPVIRQGVVAAAATTTPTAMPTAVPTVQPTATVVSSACPTDTFIDVQAHPANAEYPAPVLNVSCTATELVIQTNNVPNFEFVPITPN
jgi:hypothetical protein